MKNRNAVVKRVDERTENGNEGHKELSHLLAEESLKMRSVITIQMGEDAISRKMSSYLEKAARILSCATLDTTRGA
jgi:hypothetical protein